MSNAPHILVAQADSSAVTGGPAFPLSVGVVRWGGAGQWLAVVVKAAFGFAGDAERVRAAVLPQPPELHLDVSSTLDGALDTELEAPSDFVFRKAQCDVLVVGHGYAATPTTRLAASLRTGRVDRGFLALAEPAQLRIPLCAARIRAMDGTATDPVGPAGPVGREAPSDTLDATDFDRFSAASACQRMGWLAPDAVVELVGLSPAAARRVVELPGLVPAVVVEAGRWGDHRVELRCDTLLIDTDLERMTLSWRGSVELAYADGREIERVVLSLERAAEPRRRAEVLRALGRAELGLAVEVEDVRAGRAPTLAGPALQVARLELLEHAAEPRLTLEEYARISAELAEQDVPRDRVLERHLLDEDEWTIEERAWLERMGESAAEGDGRIAVEFGERFVAAQDELAGPDEPRSLDEYAKVRVAMERSEDPSQLLERCGLRLAQWMRLDRSWQSRAQADRATRAELDERTAFHRAGAERDGGRPGETDGGAGPEGTVE